MQNNQLVWTIKANDQFSPVMRKMSRDTIDVLEVLKKSSRATVNAIDQLPLKLAKNFNMLPDTISRITHSIFNLKNAIIGAITAGGIYELKEGIASLANQASDVAETTDTFNALFGGQSDAAKNFAKSLGESAKRSKYDIMEMMSSIQGSLVTMGLAGDKASDLSEKVVKLAVDVGSFRNVADAEVLQDFQAAIMGQTRGVMRYGIIINDTAVKQKMLNMKLWDGTGEADELTQAMARLQIITDKMKLAQGDAANSAQEYEAQLKGLAAAKKDLSVSTGKIFMDAIKESGIVAGLAEQYGKLKEWILDHKEVIKVFSKEGLEVLESWAGKAKDAFTGWAQDKSFEGWLNSAALGMKALVAYFNVALEAMRSILNLWMPVAKIYYGSEAAKHQMEVNLANNKLKELDIQENNVDENGKKQIRARRETALQERDNAQAALIQDTANYSAIEQLQKNSKSGGLGNALQEATQAYINWQNRNTTRTASTNPMIVMAHGRDMQNKLKEYGEWTMSGLKWMVTPFMNMKTPEMEPFSPFVKGLRAGNDAYSKMLAVYSKSQKIGNIDFTSDHFQKNMPALAGLARQAVSLRDMSRAERQRALEYISNGARNWKSESPEGRRAYVGSLRDMTNPYGKDEFRNTALIFKKESDMARKEELKAMNTLVGAMQDTKKFWQNVGDVAKKNLAMTGGH